MDQKRLILAIGISAAIIVLWQLLVPVHHPDPPRTAAMAERGVGSTAPKPLDTIGASPQDAGVAQIPPPTGGPRVRIEGARVSGSISLLGARIDDLVLNDYRETLAPDSPLVRLLEPPGQPQPGYVQFGWSASPSVKVPDPSTTWQTSAPAVTPGKPLKLTWENGSGLTFEIVFTLDDNYMFGVQQIVHNGTGAAVEVHPWMRARRDYAPHTEGYYILHEGMVGWLDGRLRETKYSDAKSEGGKNGGVAFTATSPGGWAGFTDKYWLTALVPDAMTPTTATYRHATGAGGDAYQVDFVTKEALPVPANGSQTISSRAFVGAKEVKLLNHYQDEGAIPHFSNAVDWGWFEVITKPFFYAIDWFNHLFGNFGLAILAFTICVKAAFFPLANYSYRSMSKMKLLTPKMQALREQYKDDPAKMQSQVMAMYKAEKVNPASGCLPMLLQIPIFFSLYKVIFITIEMRHAPFFGWVHDLSAVDPTNVFNLFGLIPFDPATVSPLLHLGVWPLFMGLSMWGQQKLNPPPPDPMQAKLFQFMPIVFTFMLARFPVGLVIYWTWNNLLTIGQQWLIMRQTRLARPGLART